MVVRYDGIRRRACFSREKPVPAVGVANIVLEEPRRYIFFADFDRDTIPECLCREFNEYIIARTRKGYHFIGFRMLAWKQLNSLWTRYKSYLDRKWINLQRKRGYAILRIAGKYRKHDIAIEECVCDIWWWWCCRYVELLNILSRIPPHLVTSSFLNRLLHIIGVYCNATSKHQV